MEQLNLLANFGAIGVVLAWVLWRIEPQLRQLERAVDRLTRAQMLTLLALPEVEEPIKRQAQTVLRELDRINGGGGRDGNGR